MNSDCLHDAPGNPIRLPHISLWCHKRCLPVGLAHCLCRGSGVRGPQLGHFAKRLNQQLREHKSNSRVEPGQAGGPGWSRVQCWDERARLTGDGVADDASAAGAAAAAAAAASAVAVGCRAHCR